MEPSVGQRVLPAAARDEVSLTSQGEAGVFLSYALQLRVQEEAEVDAFSHGGEGEEARRDTGGDLRLVVAESQMVERLLWVLGTQLQDIGHAGAQSRERVIQSKVADTELKSLTLMECCR